ncbi:MAG TPA: hypothetical protein VNC12_02840 [Solirubrobacteraceae bacterium]|nr:hypothetical protein [Solirubrobacteraceae bacterium]
MSTVTLHDEIADLERLLAGAQALIATSREPGGWLRAADQDDEEEDDLFGDDDLGFDDVDEDELEEDDDALDEDLDDEEL